MVSPFIPRLVAGTVCGHAFREDGPGGSVREDVPLGRAKCKVPVSFRYSVVSNV